MLDYTQKNFRDALRRLSPDVYDDCAKVGQPLSQILSRVFERAFLDLYLGSGTRIISGEQIGILRRGAHNLWDTGSFKFFTEAENDHECSA